MSAQTKEQQFVTYSSYNKPVSPTSTPVDTVEEWLDRFPEKRVENKPNNGIIQSTGSVIFLDMYRSNADGEQLKKASAKAQQEHKQALRNLANADKGTAREIERQRKVWKREDVIKAKAIEKQKREMAQQKKAEKKRLGRQSIARKSKAVDPRLVIMAARRNEIISTLMQGGRIKYESFLRGDSKEQMANHKLQRNDMVAIVKLFDKQGLEVVRIKRADTDDSFFMLDNIPRYELEQPIQPSNLKSKQGYQPALEVIKSGKMLCADDVTGKVNKKTEMISRLVKNHDIKIYIVYRNKTIIGWTQLND